MFHVKHEFSTIVYLYTKNANSCRYYEIKLFIFSFYEIRAQTYNKLKSRISTVIELKKMFIINVIRMNKINFSISVF